MLGLSLKDKSSLVYWAANLLRRAYLAFIYVYAKEMFYWQWVCLLITTMAIIGLIGYSHTRDRSIDKSLDIFNEVSLILLLYNVIVFT